MKRKAFVFVCAALVSLTTTATAYAKDTVTWWSWSTEATEALSSQAAFAEENDKWAQQASVSSFGSRFYLAVILR